MVNEKSLIGTGKASRKLGISPQGLRLRTLKGKVAVIVVDGRFYYDRHAIERMAAKQEVSQ